MVATLTSIPPQEAMSSPSTATPYVPILFHLCPSIIIHPILSQTKPLGRGGVGNILTQTRTREAARFSEGHPHTKALVHASLVQTVVYERSVIERTGTEALGVVSEAMAAVIKFSIVD